MAWGRTGPPQHLRRCHLPGRGGARGGAHCPRSQWESAGRGAAGPRACVPTLPPPRVPALRCVLTGSRRGADRAVGAAGDGRQVRGRSALPAPGRQRLHCSAPPPSLLSRAREAAPAPPDICIRAARLSPRSSRGPETRGAGGGAGPEGAEGPRGVSSPLRARAGALGASAARPTGSPAVRLRCRVPDAWTAEPSGSRERARSSEPPCPPAAAAAAPPGHPLSPHSYRCGSQGNHLLPGVSRPVHETGPTCGEPRNRCAGAQDTPG